MRGMQASSRWEWVFPMILNVLCVLGCELIYVALVIKAHYSIPNRNANKTLYKGIKNANNLYITIG